MNYFPFNVGDYAAHTGHLEPMEDLAYRRLLDQYYLREGPLPADIEASAKLVRMRSMKADVESVLKEFFTLTDEGWRHSRCDSEIEKMQDKQAKARASGLASANARSKAQQAAAERALLLAQADAERSLPSDSTSAQLPTPTPTPKEKTPHSPQGGASPTSLKAWLEAIKAKSERPIPAGDPVLAYADRVGLPRDYLVLAWQQFVHCYTVARERKRYRDWRQVFRNAVEGNWLKLWYLDASENYSLTTVGHQAQRAHDDRKAA